MKIYQVEFVDCNGEKEVHNFWQNSMSSLEKFIGAMTRKGDLVFIKAEVIKEL